jgi:hypothetical protein
MGNIILLRSPTSPLGNRSAPFTPNAGFSISAVSNYADGASVTVTGPAGSFGTKPGGALINYLARYGYGYNPQGGVQDPLSRNSWSDSFWPATGATGPSSGHPGLQSTTKAPGSAQAFQTIFPGAAVITGTLTNGSSQITSCVDQGVSGATPFASVDYAFGGIVAGNSSWQGVTTSSQTQLGSGIINLSSSFVGTTGSYTINIAYGPDQWSNPKPLIATPTQDQIFAFRGMNSFGWRSTNFNLQNNKFIRSFTRVPGQGLDLDFASDGNGSNHVVLVNNAGTTVTSGAGLIYFNGSQSWTYVANQWFRHELFVHCNSTSSSTDAGLIYIADSSALFGSYGTMPNMGVQFYGSGGGPPSQFDINDIACRPFLPEGNDATYLDYTMFEDSACCIQIGSGNNFEMQWPTAWSDTSVTFTMHRSYLDATLGSASLNGLSLVVQKSDYTRTSCGSFTAAA